MNDPIDTPMKLDVADLIALRDSLRNAAGSIDLILKDSSKLNMPVTDLDLSVRSANGLKSSGIKTIGELISMTEIELIRNNKNLGSKSLHEIKDVLREHGLRFKLNYLGGF